MSKAPRLHRLHPERCDPLLWTLIVVCGFTTRAIHDETGISSVTLYRMRRGYTANARTRTLLKELLERTRDGFTDYVETYHNPAIDAWRKAVYGVINHALTLDIPQEHLGEPTPSERHLIAGIHRMLLKGPLPSSKIFGAYEGVSRELIYRAAKHLKVKRSFHGFGKDKQSYWSL